MFTKALTFILDKHKDQQRKVTHLPYIVHCCSVASLLRQHGMQNEDILAAALLHDTLEDTKTTPEELEETFNQQISLLVKELTNDQSKINQLNKIEYMKIKLESLSVYGFMIKVADFLDNFLDAKYTSYKLEQFEQRRKDILAFAEKKNHPPITVSLLNQLRNA